MAFNQCAGECECLMTINLMMDILWMCVLGCWLCTGTVEPDNPSQSTLCALNGEYFM